MMNSLVTGCAGFIGSHLCERLLSEGHDVVGVDCFTDYYSRELKEENMSGFREHPSFMFHEEDLLEADLSSLLDDVDYIFHQAAQAGVRYSWGSSFEVYTRNNILATQKLLEACKEKEIKKFIYASSSSVYGNCPELPMREDSLPDPVSPYGVSKLAAEHLCSLYNANYSIPTVSLRYFTVYGPRQRPDMAFHRFLKAIMEGGEIEIYGDGRQTRDYTFISDVVEANLRAMGSGEGVYNIGGGARRTLNEVIDVIEEVTGKKANKKNIDKQKGDMRHTYADISKAENELSYCPSVSLKDGLSREWDWMSR